MFHGTEQQPVIVLDDFVKNPDILIADAAMLAFCPIGPHYPGIRAAVPAALVASFIKDIGGMIADVFGLSSPAEILESYYSIVTTPGEALKPIQRLPHFDSVEPGRIAMLHYLGRHETGGTAFFRHRATGFESVSATRHSAYVAALEKDVALCGLPPAEYITGDTALFEQAGHYAARFNRVIVYRGNTLHCADIPRDMALLPNPETGRLTINTFLTGVVRNG